MILTQAGDMARLTTASMYVRFAEAIRTGQSVEPDFDSAVRRHKLLESIQAASDQGRRVHLD